MKNLYYLNPRTLEYKRVRTLPTFLILLVISIGLYGFITKNNESVKAQDSLVKNELYEPFINVINVNDTIDEFNEKLLINYIKDLNIKFPHIVLAQSKLETGHFKSKIFIENNNLFGMKEARVRAHTAKGTQYGHAYYDDWRQSVIDYALYQSRYLSDIKNEKQYYRYLDKSYAESENYSGTLQDIIEREKLDEVFLVK